MNWNPFKRSKPVEPMPIAQPTPTVGTIQFGSMAEVFKASDQWRFFLLLAAKLRADAFRETQTDAASTLAAFTRAKFAEELPRAVDAAIAAKNAILRKQNQEQEQNQMSEARRHPHLRGVPASV